MRCVVALAAFAAVAGANGSGLPAEVQSALAANKLSSEAISVYVRDVRKRQPLIAHLADVPRNPASVMKLVTTYAALDLLGPAFTWKTLVYADGKITNGRLDGDLYLRGGGDPFLVTETLWRMLRALRQQGLREIRGDLVIDGSRFDVVRGNPGAFDNSPYRAYNQFPRALLFSFNATRFHFWPDVSAERVLVSLEPPSTTIRVDNQLRLVSGRCRGRQRRLDVEVIPGTAGAEVRFAGEYPRRCGPHSLLRSVTSPEVHAFGSFDALWRELGGSFQGRLREGRVPKGARALLVWPSLPLADVVRSINKYSNNVMSRQVLVTLGAERAGRPGTVRKGRQVIADWMRARGVLGKGFKIDNGSGLSRTSRITATSLGRMLVDAYHHPLMPEFIASLPLAATDGTLRKRFKGKGPAGRAHMKTGLIRHVRALGGYHLSRTGRTYAVAVLHNETDVHIGTGTKVQDALVEWLHER